jgi:hypothetical protein
MDTGRDNPTKMHHTLPISRAFVVQLRAEADLVTGPVTGRVEHVLSGQATAFASLDELRAFMAGCLAPLGPQPSNTQ